MELSIGTRLIRRVVDHLRDYSLDSPDDPVDEVFLHVQHGNDDAVALYSRAGFHVVEEVKQYYSRLDPPDAWILAMNLTSSATSSDKR